MYYVRFMYATKIRLRENLTGEIFYRRKFPDLRYVDLITLLPIPSSCKCSNMYEIPLGPVLMKITDSHLSVAAVPSWGPWSEWSGCSHTCGGGKRLRLRSCLDGDFCEGNSTYYDECNTQECPSSKHTTVASMFPEIIMINA
jgi:hypothetical protein